MDFSRIIGGLLVLLPFVIMSVFMVLMDGWKMFFTVWASVIGITGLIGLGTYLLVCT